METKLSPIRLPLMYTAAVVVAVHTYMFAYGHLERYMAPIHSLAGLVIVAGLASAYMLMYMTALAAIAIGDLLDSTKDQDPSINEEES